MNGAIVVETHGQTAKPLAEVVTTHPVIANIGENEVKHVLFLKDVL